MEIDKVDITYKDGRKITIFVDEDQGFFRESEMVLGKNKLQIQEVYITNGRVLKRKSKDRLSQSA